MATDKILKNPNAPYINQLAKSANAATNYFAIAHPSLNNYLEVLGRSNYGVHTDNYPDWHNTALVDCCLRLAMMFRNHSAHPPKSNDGGVG